MPTGPTLEYGSTPRVSARRLLARVVAVFAVGAACWISLRYAARSLYYYDRDHVVADLSAVPGVQILSVDGPDDGFQMTVASAWFTIGGNPARSVCLLSPAAGDLASGRRMRIATMGAHGVYVEVGDSRQMVQYLDVGKDSEFAQILPFKLKNVGDLVAHYDEVLALINRQPSGQYITKDGKTCSYRIRIQ